MSNGTTDLLMLFKLSKIELKKIICEEKLNIRILKNDSINDVVSKIWVKRVFRELKSLK